MTIFRSSLLAVCVAAGAASAGADGAATSLQSGLSATLIEEIWEPQSAPAELWLRLRFLVPDLARIAEDFELVGTDLAALCRDVALPAIAKAGRKADQAVISLSSAAIPFGQTSPDVLQIFEAFRVSGGDCILEGF